MLKSTLLFLLRVFSKALVKKYKPDVVGITGSVGKTSAKEAIAKALSCKFSLRASHKNYNNEIGVPLCIIGIKESPGRSWWGWLKVFLKALRLMLVRSSHYPQILILEMGADRPGDIQYLTNIAPCKVGVLTSIGEAHIEYFKTLRKIAQEKRVIISHLSVGDYAVLNFDDKEVMAQRKVTRAEVITYGFKEGAELVASDVRTIEDEKTSWPDGLNFKVTYGGNTVPVFLPGAIATPSIYAVLAALAVAQAFGVNLVEAAECLRALKPLPGHLRLIAGIKETLIIDDTYNSSPAAALAALEALNDIKVRSGGERYAILGDMLELGMETEDAHRNLGFKVAEANIDYLIAVGEAAKQIASAAKEAGLDEHKIATFADAAAAGRFLQDKLAKGDVILVKGSQGVRLEKVVKEIMAKPLEANDLLVRQEDSWLD